MPPSLLDPFHRALHTQVSKTIDDRMVNLAQGGAASIEGSAQTVAEKYAAHVSYIKALSDVLGWCEELEREQYGLRPSEEGEGQGGA